MAPPRPRVALLAVAGLLLLANPVWLVPHEGETLHTYERNEVVVEDGILAYEDRRTGPFDDENDLTPVGCDDYEASLVRACALDRHLVEHGPIPVSRDTTGEGGPEFVRLDDAYYRRITRYDDSAEPPTLTLDVERVAPETVLAESAVNLSEPDSVRPDHGVRLRVLLTGESETSFTELSDHALGTVYQRDGSYYVLVLTEERVIDHGPPLEALEYEVPRYLLAAIGALLLAAIYLIGHDRSE